jgi:hypothetical protein
VHAVPRAVQAEQLALALEPDGVMLVFACRRPDPPDGRVLGMAKAAEWFAREAAAKVALIVHERLLDNAALEPVLYGAVRVASEIAPAADDERQGEVRVFPVIGRPHPCRRLPHHPRLKPAASSGSSPTSLPWTAVALRGPTLLDVDAREDRRAQRVRARGVAPGQGVEREQGVEAGDGGGVEADGDVAFGLGVDFGLGHGSSHRRSRWVGVGVRVRRGQ